MIPSENNIAENQGQKTIASELTVLREERLTIKPEVSKTYFIPPIEQMTKDKLLMQLEADAAPTRA